MKKIRILSIIITIILYLFVFNIEVNAADSASCYYMHNNTKEDSFPIYKQNIFGVWSVPESKLLITIQYSSEKEGYTTPVIKAKIVSNDDFTSFSTGQEFLNILNNKGVAPADYNFHDLPFIYKTQLMSNNDEMMCPNIYLYGSETQSQVDSTYSRYYIISLEGELDSQSNKFKYKKTLTPLNISKVSSGKATNYSKFSCNYNIQNFHDGFSDYTGEIMFEVNDNGEVFDLHGTRTLENIGMTYTGGNLSKCPQYIKINGSIGNGITIQEGTENSYNGVLNGDINNAEENKNIDGKLIAKYLKYGDRNKYITIEQVGGNYNINLTESESKAIVVSNIDEYMSFIESDKGGDLPRYIVKLQGETSYIFVESMQREDGSVIETDEIYINKESLSPDGTGLGDEELYNTCKQLFGESFLQFLYDKVFKIIWIGIPLLLILLTSYDFAKVVFNDDKDGMQSAFKRFGRRAVAAILIFLTPYIIILIANIIGAGETVESCAKTLREMGKSVIIITNDLTNLK